MAGFNYPNDITKDTPAVAAEVQGNFDALLTFLLDAMIQRDGTVSMTAPLTLFGTPSVASHAANKAYVDAVLPVGMVVEYAGDTLPSSKWLWCNGDIYSDTDKPLLFNAIGRGYTEAAVPAGSFQVPDRRGRVGIGVGRVDGTTGTDFVRGAKGGKADSELLQHLHSVPTHGHTASSTGGSHGHGNTLAVTGAGTHVHTGRDNGFVYWASNYGTNQSSTTPVGPNAPWGLSWQKNVDGDGSHTHGLSGGVSTSTSHAHTITVNDKTAFNTVNAGAGTTLVDKNLPPYVVSNYIIYAGE